MTSIVVLITILLGLIFWGLSHLVSVLAGASIVSCDNKTIIEALKLANAKPGERLLDLGCGWGKVLAIAEKLGLKAEGIDISPAAVLWNRLWGRKVKWQNLTKTQVDNFDLVFIYLLPKLIRSLNLKIKKSDRVIAIDFPLPDRKPMKTKKVGKCTIYLYSS